MKKSARNKFFRTIILPLVAVYIVILIYMYFNQSALLYPAPTIYKSPTQLGLNKFEEVIIKTLDNLDLMNWYIPSERDQKTILYFGGNASSLVKRNKFYSEINNKGFGVFAVQYRGYGGNAGEPTESDLYNDARIAIKYLNEQRNIPIEKIILMGRSLGTGIAVKMATEFNVNLVVLISPYDSIAEVSQVHYPYLPAKYLIKDKYNVVDIAGGIKSPVLIFHSDDDKVIPISHAEKLYNAIKADKVFYELEGQGHNNLKFNNILNQVKSYGK